MRAYGCELGGWLECKRGTAVDFGADALHCRAAPAYYLHMDMQTNIHTGLLG